MRRLPGGLGSRPVGMTSGADCLRRVELDAASGCPRPTPGWTSRRSTKPCKSWIPIHPRKVQVVELRFFGGFSVEQAADTLRGVHGYRQARLALRRRCGCCASSVTRTSDDARSRRPHRTSVSRGPGACDEADRAAFPGRARVAGDESLLREVSSLLPYDEAAERFLPVPALDVIAQMAAGHEVATAVVSESSATDTLAPSTRFGIYEVLSHRQRRHG